MESRSRRVRREPNTFLSSGPRHNDLRVTLRAVQCNLAFAFPINYFQHDCVVLKHYCEPDFVLLVEENHPWAVVVDENSGLPPSRLIVEGELLRGDFLND